MTAVHTRVKYMSDKPKKEEPEAEKEAEDDPTPEDEKAEHKPE